MPDETEEPTLSHGRLQAFRGFGRATYLSPVDMRRRSPVVAALISAVAVFVLAACGAVPPASNGTSGTPSDLPSPSTVIPSDSPAPDTPSPSAPDSPSPKPTEPPEPAGPDCDKLKCIALTYDDGPFPYTSRLAEIMREEKVKATFFMLGQNVERYPQAVRDVLATGSELANHSWDHPSLPKLSTSGMRSQLQRTNEAIEKISGTKVTLMRPPYGENNQRLDAVCRKLGLAEIYWDVDTLDWKNPDRDRLVDLVTSNAARDQVVLMHDIHEATVDAAPAIFKALKKRGFTLVTVSELYPTLRPGGHYPLYQGRGFAKKSDYPRRTSAKR